nr:MAG TPA: hypothetical protein [Caudoviricetes sp.]
MNSGSASLSKPVNFYWLFSFSKINFKLNKLNT